MNTNDFKQHLKQLLLNLLQLELDAAFEAVNEAHANATHEQSKPENQYDTLALEAAYLAHGQSERIAELQEHIAIINNLEVRAFSTEEAASVGALVTLLDECGVSKTVWVLPCAGGETLETTAVHPQLPSSIITVTPQAPLGKKILGTFIGEEFTLSLPNSNQMFEIEQII